MKIEITWTPAQLKTVSTANEENTIAVVVDVLRATTCMACALYNGAEVVIPAYSHDEARQLRLCYPGALLCGEVNHLKPQDFDLGNSPKDFTSRAVKNRTLIHASSNGTKAIVAIFAAGVKKIYTGCFAQLSVLTEALEHDLKEKFPSKLLLAAAGSQDGASYEDLLFISCLLYRLGMKHPVISLWRACDPKRLFEHLSMSKNGRALVKKGLVADVLFAASIDTCPVLTRVCEKGFVVAWK